MSLSGELFESVKDSLSDSPALSQSVSGSPVESDAAASGHTSTVRSAGQTTVDNATQVSESLQTSVADAQASTNVQRATASVRNATIPAAGVLQASAQSLCGVRDAYHTNTSPLSEEVGTAPPRSSHEAGPGLRGLTEEAYFKQLQQLEQCIIRDRDAGRAYMVPAASHSHPNATQTLLDVADRRIVTFNYDSLPERTEGVIGHDIPLTLPDPDFKKNVVLDAAPESAGTKQQGARRQKKAWYKLFPRRRGDTNVAPRKAQIADIDIDVNLSGSINASSAQSETSSCGQESSLSRRASASDATTSGATNTGPASLRQSHSLLSKEDASKAVPVHAHKKVLREFTKLRHVQALKAHEGVIWKIVFSQTGSYMATAGQDKVIRIWENRRAPLECSSNRKDVASSIASLPEDAFSNGVVSPHAYREFRGHGDDIFDLCWSDKFLLSASRDKTVRLWHLKQDSELKLFRHDAYVMAVVLHPINATRFVSCAWDGKVRLQQVEPPKVLDWKQTQLTMQTLNIGCVAISSRGDRVFVGCHHGRVRQYDVPQASKLEHHVELDVRDKRKRGKDTPVSGLDVMPQRPDALLVTSRDSRIRLFRGTSCVVKYKGLQNSVSRIAASFSQDGHYIICGSDDGVVYIWLTDTEASLCLPAVRGSYTPCDGRMKNSSYEAFRACNRTCTVALFVPAVPDPHATQPTPFSTESKCTADSALTTAGQEPARISVKSFAGVKEALKTCKVESDASHIADAVKRVQNEARKMRAYGRIVAAAGADGAIHFFENFGGPEWA